jgi:maleamate amidohydrolase
VVVDFSLGFTDPAYRTGAEMDVAVLGTAQLIAAAREAARPVIFTTIAFPSPEAGGVWLQKAPGLGALQEGSRLVELDPRLGRRPEEPLIVKQGASGFFGTGLAALLTSLEADTVLLCGATTSGCVRASAVDSVQSGFPTLVVRQCVADRTPGAHEASLVDLQSKYADVVELGDAIAYVAGLNAEVTP